jgi:hypothetical protein
MLQRYVTSAFCLGPPFLCLYFGNGICHVLPGYEQKLFTFLKGMGQYLIEHRALQAVGFRFIRGV